MGDETRTMENQKDVKIDGGVDNDKTSPQPPQGPVETDDFGLPIRRYRTPVPQDPAEEEASGKGDGVNGAADTDTAESKADGVKGAATPANDNPVEETNRDDKMKEDGTTVKDTCQDQAPDPATTQIKEETVTQEPTNPKSRDEINSTENATASTLPSSSVPDTDKAVEEPKDKPETESGSKRPGSFHPGHAQQASIASVQTLNEGGLSEFSHQKLSAQPKDEKENDDDDGWQEMPSYARYDMYDDDDRLIAREHDDEEDEKYAYGGLGGAGKGYTRVQLDDDAESATSMDDNTQYLFKHGKTTAIVDDDEEARDAASQMQTTKDLLTEGQRIAYVGLVRLELSALVKKSQELESTRKIKKEVNMAAEAMQMWEQKMMIRLYAHMDISEAEQVMIEQLAAHGVVPGDLTPALYANARVRNPMADERKEADEEGGGGSPPAYPDDEKSGISPKTSSEDGKSGTSPKSSSEERAVPSDYAPMPSANDEKAESSAFDSDDEKSVEPPPPYEMNQNGEVPDAQTPSQLPSTEKIDIDLRWTVLCDLFLILILDSVYDARSRVLLERVANSLDIPWVDICRFEKRVTDALEMQQAAEKENWNEDEHMENRRKKALKKRYMMMGLATVGGGLVIGLSAGLLAPMIGAGLAAGFTTIGVAGTGSFLGGVGGAAIITSGAVASGGIIGVRAADRRTGAVKTFEYRPLHNNKRVNLVVTVSGWLTGSVDDVRLPFSTVDPVMGDLYSVLWEPELLTSMGDTIRILATEVCLRSLFCSSITTIL